MDASATYLQVGFILISVPNALVIVGMIVLLIAAVLAPFPGHHRVQDDDDQPD